MQACCSASEHGTYIIQLLQTFIMTETKRTYRQGSKGTYRQGSKGCKDIIL